MAPKYFMACLISFDDQQVLLNNMQFSRLIDFGVQMAKELAAPSEQKHIDRMKKLDQEYFYPGSGFDITEDFPDQDERKFWCRIFFEVARAIVDGRLGKRPHVFYWRAQAVYQSYGTARLFQEAVWKSERGWEVDTTDGREAEADQIPPLK